MPKTKTKTKNDKIKRKPTVTLVLTIDEPITKKNLALYLKSYLLYGPHDWITEHLKDVRVRSIDFD